MEASSVRLALAALVAVGAVGCARTAANELAFLKRFRHTGGAEPDGSRSYRIFGDPAKVLAAIPSAASALVETTSQGSTVDFSLPSGKRATLVFRKGGRSARLLIDP